MDAKQVPITAQHPHFAKAFKVAIVIETISAEKTINQTASIYQVHPNQPGK